MKEDFSNYQQQRKALIKLYFVSVQVLRQDHVKSGQLTYSLFPAGLFL